MHAEWCEKATAVDLAWYEAQRVAPKRERRSHDRSFCVLCKDLQHSSAQRGEVFPRAFSIIHVDSDGIQRTLYADLVKYKDGRMLLRPEPATQLKNGDTLVIGGMNLIYQS